MNCPDCGSTSVSVEVGSTGTGRLVHRVCRAAEGDPVEVVRGCWTCGWRETRVVSVDAIDVESGDQDVVVRERLLSELTEAAAGLDSASLEAALAAMMASVDSARSDGHTDSDE